jgi:hypothetical protein
VKDLCLSVDSVCARSRLLAMSRVFGLKCRLLADASPQNVRMILFLASHLSKEQTLIDRYDNDAILREVSNQIKYCRRERQTDVERHSHEITADILMKILKHC